jgi:hypothetical protein
MPTINATPAASNANSYETLDEANTYFDERIPLATPWVASGDLSIAAIIMATRVIDTVLQPRVTFDVANACYRTRPTWTGAPSTTTQRLAWPRTGMFDRNGNAIPSGEIPQDLKDAVSELAGQLIMGDRTLDNDSVVQGVSSVSAGSVSVSFRDVIEAKYLPDAVWNLMPPSWYTSEGIDYATQEAEFEVL